MKVYIVWECHGPYPSDFEGIRAVFRHREAADDFAHRMAVEEPHEFTVEEHSVLQRSVVLS